MKSNTVPNGSLSFGQCFYSFQIYSTLVAPVSVKEINQIKNVDIIRNNDWYNF